MVANVFVGDYSPTLWHHTTKAPWHVQKHKKLFLPSQAVTVPVPTVKLYCEYLFRYLDSRCRVFSVTSFSTRRFQRLFCLRVNPNMQKDICSHRIDSHRNSCTESESRTAPSSPRPPPPPGPPRQLPPRGVPPRPLAWLY
jgi:hypothetical protein